MHFRELQELAPHVYLFPRDKDGFNLQPNVGIIRGAEQTILIDTGNSPQHARHIMAAMAGEDFPPIETLIFTHHHWDHTFGACVYNAERIVAHRENLAYMQAYAADEWSEAAVRERAYRNPRRELSMAALRKAIPDWSDFRICTPNVTFSKTLTLHAGNIALELEHIPGGRHSRDAVVVKIPQASVMFLGDCYYPPPYHLRDEGDDDLALEMLDYLAGQHYALYIDGHGDPRTLFEFQRMIEQEKTRQHQRA